MATKRVRTATPLERESLPQGLMIEDAALAVLSDGRAGHQNQSVGVAEALGFESPEVFSLLKSGLPRWLSWLPVGMVFDNLAVIEHELRRMMANKPLVLIGTGTQVSRVLRYMKARLGKEVFTVALMRPSGCARDYDVVAVPQHDGYAVAENVVETLGPANRITRQRLEVEADRWRKRLSGVTRPYVAVLVGGSSRHGAMPLGEVESLMEQMIELAKARHHGLLVTASRRTGEAASARIEEMLRASPVRHYFWQPDMPQARDNPYLAYLGLADAVVVTADSVSMVCEAAASGKPVYVWGKADEVAPKFSRLFAALVKQGRVKWWDGKLNLRAPAAGLMDTLMIAGFVRARWDALRARRA